MINKIWSTRFRICIWTISHIWVDLFESVWSFPIFSPVPLMIIALLGTGIYTTINLNFPQIRYLKHGIKVTKGD